MRTPTPRAATVTAAPTAPELLGTDLYEEAVGYAAARSTHGRDHAERQVGECLRYLYLVSRHPDRLGGLFLPVEQEIDEIWHFLILQTREYRQLCEERLPGAHFIHHRSITYAGYRDDHGVERTRERSIEEALRWIPLYTAAFGPFDEDALPHWTMVRFLHEEMGMSLAQISALGPPDPAPPVPAPRAPVLGPPEPA
ncbi:hypothetical protein [Streptomyces sp. NPDC057939]|uniref:hypothetical protein n=1 Tax=Streptomyces sp. NPDC057939 TaxID=3346284 RepID=UPI0036ED1BD2